MTFKVISGGALTGNDIPCPNKPAKDWTEEEREAYDRYLWENQEPGTPEAGINRLNFSPDETGIFIEMLEATRAALEKEAEESGYRSEWPLITAEELLGILRQRQRSEAVAVPN